MARAAVELLGWELQEAYEDLRGCVDGLTDDAFFWEPVAGCWTVRRRDDGRWAVDYPGTAASRSGAVHDDRLAPGARRGVQGHVSRVRVRRGEAHLPGDRLGAHRRGGD